MCRTVVPTGQGCATCRDRREARSPSFNYSTAYWSRRSRAFLARRRWCKVCGKRAKVADHYPTSRRELVRQGVPDPDADEFLRPLCLECHSRATAARQGGGWHHPE
jgi:5-methylcytosine-specific restriction protein A